MTCPTDETLAQLAHGRLVGRALEDAEAHLDTCASCRSLLAAVSNGSTPLARPERMALASGERLGRYEIDMLLAAGGMGMLYTARDVQLNRQVVLKLMRPRFAGELGHVRLLREAQAMASLNHPNVVHVYELGESEERVFVAMELVEGGTLRDWMRAPGTWKDVIAMMVQAGRGLAAAHAAGVVHRDFKPENVLVGRDGRPRVGDFGLARPELVAEEEPPRNMPMRITQTGAMLGTPAYMSPEQLQGKPADARSDQYSFCVTLFEALTGKRPFVADTVDELRARVAGGMPPPPKDGAVPAMVWAAIARGMNPSPERRFASMEELLAALTDAAPVKPAHPESRAWVARIGTAAAVLIVAGGAALTFWAVRPPPLHVPADLSFSTGQTMMFDAPGVRRAEATGHSVSRVELMNNRLTVVGGDPGEATLLLHRDDGSVVTSALHVHQPAEVEMRRQAEVRTPPEPEPTPPDLPEILELAPNETQNLMVGAITRVDTLGTGIRSVEQNGEELTIHAGKSGRGKINLSYGDEDMKIIRVRVVLPEPEAVLPPVVELELGAERRFRVPQLQRVAIGDTGVCDVVTVSNDELRISAEGLGQSTVLVWTATTRIEVTVKVGGPLVLKPNGVVSLKPGFEHVLSVPGLERVAIGNDEIADAVVGEDGELIVLGERPGRTSLLVWKADGTQVNYTVVVAKADLVPRVTNLKLKLKEDVTLRIKGLERCTASDKTIVDVICDANQISISGLDLGQATVRAWQNGAVKLFAVQVE